MRENFPGDVHAGIVFTPEEELAAYQQMLLIRRLEEKAGQLYALGEMDGPCHLSIGQEAVIVGMEMAASPEDAMISGFRCHGHLVARGAELDAILAELLGRVTGLCGGRAGSDRMLDPTLRFYGGHTELAQQVPIGAGLALAARQQDDSSICICAVGDGAANKGQVYETLRLAAEWKLPLVLVIDNNSTETSEQLSTSLSPTALAQRGAAFGIPGEQVDGIDVRKVRAAGRRAIAHARNGDGPMILEMLTYRYRGHSAPAGAQRKARAREETDPILKSRARILEDRIAEEGELKEIEKSVRERISKATSAATSAEKASTLELWTEVHA